MTKQTTLNKFLRTGATLEDANTDNNYSTMIKAFKDIREGSADDDFVSKSSVDLDRKEVTVTVDIPLSSLENKGYDFEALLARKIATLFIEQASELLNKLTGLPDIVGVKTLRDANHDSIVKLHRSVLVK